MTDQTTTHEVHRTNLLALAHFLETEPAVRKHFNMATYFAVDNECGSVACALGWAPIALGHEKQISESLYVALDYDQYSKDHFDLYPINPEWDWLFGAEWVHIDNTPEGAAARIRKFVKWDHNLPIDVQDFVDDVLLEEPEAKEAAAAYQRIMAE